MGIPHTHERVEWSSVWNVEFTFQDECDGQCEEGTEDDA